MGRNTHFQFKQFTIQQDQTAMKVCTDSCLFGALIEAPGGHWLDIGTGTGLLSLMVAQRFPKINIDALEIDAAAAAQANTNVQQSVFKEQIRVFHKPVQEHQGQYDGIFTNPPFFTDSLKRTDAAANAALHQTTLRFSELAAAACRLLKPDGKLWVLLPPHEQQLLASELANYQLDVVKKYAIKNRENQPVFREISVYSRIPKALEMQELCIYETGTTSYTAAFAALLTPYYLKL